MLKRSNIARSTLVAILGSSVAFFAMATDPVTDAIQAAYAPYRVALFKTNSKSASEALQAVQQAQREWNKVSSQYASKPLAPYDRDGRFAESLEAVAKVYVQAAAEIERNELAQSHDTLEKARDIISELRQRNQVVTYSDHMNAYHEQMEHVLIHGPKTLATTGGIVQLTADAGVLHYLAKRLESQASGSDSKNEEFQGLLKAVLKSASDLHAAAQAQNAEAVKEAIAKLKSPYSKFFLKFG